MKSSKKINSLSMKKAMLRNIMCLCIFIIGGVNVSLCQASIHSLPIRAADGSKFDLSTCKGKKIVLLVIDANEPDWKFLKTLDSLVALQHGKTIGLVVPVTDLSTKKDTRQLFKNLGIAASNLKVATFGLAKKAESNEIGLLLQWLTKKESNKHFDAKITNQNHLFGVTQEGNIFANIQQANLMKPQILSKIVSAQ
jgi:glutathione peroxidase